MAHCVGLLSPEQRLKFVVCLVHDFVLLLLAYGQCPSGAVFFVATFHSPGLFDVSSTKSLLSIFASSSWFPFGFVDLDSSR